LRTGANFVSVGQIYLLDNPSCLSRFAPNTREHGEDDPAIANWTWPHHVTASTFGSRICADRKPIAKPCLG
jgi:hypothetical protein